MTNPWMPTAYSQPLSDDFITDGDKLIKLTENVWHLPEKHDAPLRLTDWQKWLIRAALERYPDDHENPEKAGRLRYKQVVISMPRKNGKSLIGAVFALYGMLLHEPAPEVVSVAASADQARIVYRRLLHQTQNNALLKKLLPRSTEHRGLWTADGTGVYKVIASQAATAQGLHPSLVIFDELHMSKEDLWTAMSLCSGTRPDGIIIGITTAGDDNSTLLKNLYERGAQAIEGKEELERFGFFCWEAPQDCSLEDEVAVKRANPQLASGILSWEAVKTELATMPEADARRYRLNQFVSSMNAWLPVGTWQGLSHGTVTNPIVFTVDRTPGWDHACIVAAGVEENGLISTELVASFNNSNIDELARATMELAGKYSATFVMDSYVLQDLYVMLKQRGYNVFGASNRDLMSASNNAYRKIMKREVQHPKDELVTLQIQAAVRKNVNESWKISRKDSSIEIDAAIATVLAIWFADSRELQMPGLV
jgi:phage terminase large subunit-like protein